MSFMIQKILLIDRVLSINRIPNNPIHRHRNSFGSSTFDHIIFNLAIIMSCLILRHVSNWLDLFFIIFIIVFSFFFFFIHRLLYITVAFFIHRHPGLSRCYHDIFIRLFNLLRNWRKKNEHHERPTPKSHLAFFCTTFFYRIVPCSSRWQLFFRFRF